MCKAETPTSTNLTPRRGSEKPAFCSAPPVSCFLCKLVFIGEFRLAVSQPPSDEGGGFCEAKDGGRELSPCRCHGREGTIYLSAGLSLRRVPLASAPKARKVRPRRSPLGIPLKQMICAKSVFGTRKPERANPLPRSPAPAALNGRLEPLLRSALFCRCPVGCRAVTGTPKQRQKEPDTTAGAGERGKRRMFSSKACRPEKYCTCPIPP